MTCPLCKECPFSKGVCEQRITRGRRFFLMGALALPLARKIESVASIIVPKPKYEAPKLWHVARIRVNGQEWTYEETQQPGVWREINSAFELMVAT